jgi:hypothetical protein
MAQWLLTAISDVHFGCGLSPGVRFRQGTDFLSLKGDLEASPFAAKPEDPHIGLNASSFISNIDSFTDIVTHGLRQAVTRSGPRGTARKVAARFDCHRLVVAVRNHGLAVFRVSPSAY